MFMLSYFSILNVIFKKAYNKLIFIRGAGFEEKVGLVSLGCPKNLVDSEIMLGKLKENFEITSDERAADIIIVNTCGFIDSAKEESINTILEMAKYKRW